MPDQAAAICLYGTYSTRSILCQPSTRLEARAISKPQLFKTKYRSQYLPLWEFSNEYELKACVCLTTLSKNKEKLVVQERLFLRLRHVLGILITILSFQSYGTSQVLILSEQRVFMEAMSECNKALVARRLR
jgi:hypothetical protein